MTSSASARAARLGAAICLGLLGSTAHAQSALNLTGTLDAFAGSMRMAGDAKRLKVLGSGGMTTSYYGFTGSEDLGGGLKATFALTAFLRNDTGDYGRFNGDPYFARDANVGLAGGFGAVILGRAKSPNFLPTIFVNPFGDSFTFAPLVLHANINTASWGFATTPSDTGWGNSITYSTPSFFHATANLQYQFGEQSTSSGTSSNRGNLGGNLLYLNGPVTLVAFYEKDQVSNPNPSLFTTTLNGVTTLLTRKDWMVGGAYDAGVVKGFASFGRASSDPSTTVASTTSLGLSVPVGVGFVLAGVARTKVTGAFEGRRTTSTLEYDYFLSKRTDLYAVAMRDQVTDVSSGNSAALGVRHRF